ncbi:MAG: hypothetical protein U1E76_01940 [Planctomycetota bacterium]
MSETIHSAVTITSKPRTGRGLTLAVLVAVALRVALLVINVPPDLIGDEGEYVRDARILASQHRFGESLFGGRHSTRCSWGS